MFEKDGRRFEVSVASSTFMGLDGFVFKRRRGSCYVPLREFRFKTYEVVVDVVDDGFLPLISGSCKNAIGAQLLT